jgi:hypothetical protein
MELRKFIFIIIAIMLCIQAVSALGVTPARTTMGFSPGMQQTVGFTVVNSEHKDMKLNIQVQGELNQSVVVPLKSVIMSATQDSVQLNYSVSLPNSLLPGPHTADIVVTAEPVSASASEAFVGAQIAVVTQLLVNVPYPGKYALADINVVNAEQGGQSTIIIPVVNLGQDDLQAVHADITILDSQNNSVGSFSTKDISIGHGQRQEIVYNWPANVQIGKYFVKAVVSYDGGNKISLQKQFNVGSATLTLNSLLVNGFSLGQIAKFQLFVQNKWSEPVTGAYIEMQVSSQSEQIADFKSQTYDLAALANETMVAYWDTAGVAQGTYNTTAFLRYGSKEAQQNFQLRVTDTDITAIGLGYVISQNTTKSSTNTLVTVLVVVIVLLVLMNILWFLVFRKRIAKKK